MRFDVHGSSGTIVSLLGWQHLHIAKPAQAVEALDVAPLLKKLPVAYKGSPEATLLFMFGEKSVGGKSAPGDAFQSFAELTYPLCGCHKQPMPLLVARKPSSLQQLRSLMMGPMALLQLPLPVQQLHSTCLMPFCRPTASGSLRRRQSDVGA